MTEAVGALVAHMEELLGPLEADRDPGRFFLAVYLRTTIAVGAAIEAGDFEDPAWVEEWDVDFAASTSTRSPRTAATRNRRPGRGGWRSAPGRTSRRRRTCCWA